MYKIINSVCIVILAAASLSVAVDYQVPVSSIAPIIDGNSLPNEWDNALSVDVSYPDLVASGGTSYIGEPAHDDLSANVKMLWDKDNLYVFARIFDNDNVWRKSYPGPYNGQDCFQMAFNLNNDQSAVFPGSGTTIFDFAADTADGMGASAYSHSDFLVKDIVLASKELEDGWQIEIAIPWVDTFGGFAYPGNRHGFGILLVDFDGGDTSATNFIFDFGSGQNTISDVTTWNTITLIGDDGCGANGRFAGDFNGDCYVNLSDLAIIAKQWGMDTLE